LLKEIAPASRELASWESKTTPFDYFLRPAEAAATSLSVEVIPIRVEASAADIGRALGVGRPRRTADSLWHRTPQLSFIAIRSLRSRPVTALPAVYPFSYFVAEGGLLSYGTDRLEMFRQTANHVDRILRGVKPADLPVQAPIRYETTVNLKTAKALDLTVPNGILLAADEVIE
jgi:putative ABC transport system substrate-binding protein